MATAHWPIAGAAIVINTVLIHGIASPPCWIESGAIFCETQDLKRLPSLALQISQGLFREAVRLSLEAANNDVPKK